MRAWDGRCPKGTSTGAGETNIGSGAAPIFVVMNYVVLPLSAVGHAPRFRIVHFIEDTLAMLLFGLIVAFSARQRPR